MQQRRSFKAGDELTNNGGSHKCVSFFVILARSLSPEQVTLSGRETVLPLLVGVEGHHHLLPLSLYSQRKYWSGAHQSQLPLASLHTLTMGPCIHNNGVPLLQGKETP